ncbi:MAG TPA: hypothetical protein VF590_17065 [Isosphaeraceae bacterium]
MAPGEFARFIGAQGDENDRILLRLVGLRELADGLGILTRPRPAGWVWARVAGAAMDLALLGGALASGAPRPDRIAAATVAVLGVTALDVHDGLQLSRQAEPTGHPGQAGVTEVRQAITVNHPADRDARGMPIPCPPWRFPAESDRLGPQRWRRHLERRPPRGRPGGPRRPGPGP